jgi:hypothetical protein
VDVAFGGMHGRRCNPPCPPRLLRCDYVRLSCHVTRTIFHAPPIHLPHLPLRITHNAQLGGTARMHQPPETLDTVSLDETAARSWVGIGDEHDLETVRDGFPPCPVQSLSSPLSSEPMSGGGFEQEIPCKSPILYRRPFLIIPAWKLNQVLTL